MSATATITIAAAQIEAPRSSGASLLLQAPGMPGRSAPLTIPYPSLSSLDLASSSVASKCLTNDNIYSTLPTLSPSDRARFILYGIGAAIPKPFDIVHHAFAARAAATPSAIAVEHKGDTITYERLDRLSTILAAALRARGVQPGKRVCLLVQRSIAMIVGIIAIHKAGASYIPLDGGIVTNQTLGTILEDSGAALVLCTPEYEHRVPANTAHLSLDSFLVDPSIPLPYVEDLSRPSDEAYVIYTSGTYSSLIITILV
jgi:non-ribosomal peptide synthetase component F